jgi:drug/metabolite transporter (DMT)-like permease
MVSISNKTKAYLAYAYIAIIWGTTYLGIRVAVEHYPAFLMAGVRQLVSAIIMCVIAFAINRNMNLDKRNILQNAIIGFLMISVGNGVVSWAEIYVPSGVAALVCSTMPISVVCINLLASKREKLNVLIVAGMLMGFGGVALIFKNDVAALTDHRYLFGVFALLLATFGWGGGSVLSKRWGNKTNPMFDSGMQLFFGGVFLLLTSPLVDDYSTADWYNTDALMALIYLIVFGSIIAFTVYRYALKELPVGFVTSYAYINPLVAVILGALVGEPTSAWTGVSFIAVIAGVFLVNKGYQRRKRLADEHALRYPVVAQSTDIV